MGSETSEPYLPLPHSERVVSMPIVNPQTGGKSKSFRYVGLVDLHVGETIRDYKGVSDIDRFIQQAMIGYQGERYALALMHEGYTIRKVEYCLITRPSILYKHPSVSWAVVKKGNKTACKLFRAANAETKGDAAHYMAERRAKDGAGEYSIEERTSGNPTRQHYEDECIAWLNDTEHGQRVKPHSHYLNDYKLLQARWSIHNAAKHILYCRVNDRWQTNDRACHAFNRECPYLDLCVALQNGRGTETLIHEEFTTRKRNPELFGHDVGEGLPILTHSMIQDLSCNMLYYWKHERCLEKKRVADKIGRAHV